MRNGRRSQWSDVVGVLHQHRLTPLVAFVLKRHGLIELIPEPHRAEVHGTYLSTLFANVRNSQALERALIDLNRHQVVPVVLKGAVLAASYYPDIGTRPMGDVDILIIRTIPDAVGEAVEASLNASGFQLLSSRPRREQSGRRGWAPGVTGDGSDDLYEDAQGTLLDVHHRFRPIDASSAERLERPWTRPSGGSGLATVWEPNAMLVQLGCHQLKHRPSHGTILAWLLDLAFVIQRHQAELDFERIRALSPSVNSLAFLLRALHFLRSELGVELPSSLIDPVRRSAPLDLARILRERRLRPWRLPRPIGWARLVKARLIGPVGDYRFFPRLGDFALWPIDHLRESRLDRQTVETSP